MRHLQPDAALVPRAGEGRDLHLRVNPAARSPGRSRERVLFLCTGNSCRSQMAEGWTRRLFGDRVEAYSAGTAPHGLDPRAVRAMAEAGVDITGQRSKSVAEVERVPFDLVITVCDGARESCPTMPAASRVVHRSFPDPPSMARHEASEQAAMEHYRFVRDQIRELVVELFG